jgi:signal transduction histidine kinase
MGIPANWSALTIYRRQPGDSLIWRNVRAATARNVELAVSDNGEGVPESLRGKIFERFFRVESSRTTAGAFECPR